MRWVGVSLVGLSSLAAAAPTQPAVSPAIVATQQLQPGQWTLRTRGGAPESRSLCIADVNSLFQIGHSGAQCTRFVVANQSRMATVQYRCAGAGQGRTTIRVETSRLVQIDTQGVADKRPFMRSYEARRTGECIASSGTNAGQR